MTFYYLWLMALALAWGLRILAAAGIVLAAFLLVFGIGRVIRWLTKSS